MIKKLEETLNDNEVETLFCKTPELSNCETLVLLHNRINTYLVFIFSDLNEVNFIKCHTERIHI